MIGALNAIQILVLSILFRLEIPQNMHDIMGPILKLSNFDVFQTDYLYLVIFGFGETPYFDQVFSDSGFEGSNFVVGIGPIFIMVVFFLSWVPMQMLMKYIVEKYKIKWRCIKFMNLLEHGDRRF